jgi:hypothetical protein
MVLETGDYGLLGILNCKGITLCVGLFPPPEDGNRLNSRKKMDLVQQMFTNQKPLSQTFIFN